jgi:hypothetical protein
MTRLTQALSGLGAPLASALLMAAVATSGAQAQTIGPDDTTITAVAQNPTFNFEGVEITCTEGTAVGTTGIDSPTVNLELDFGPPGECVAAETWPFTVTCSEASGDDDEFGTAMLRATDADSNLGIVDRLNPGFLCTMTFTGVCDITIAAQDLPSDVGGFRGRQQANLIDEGTADPDIDAVVDVEANSNNPSCGPAQGDVGFSGVYDLDTAIRFD